MSDADFETAKQWVSDNVKSLTDDQQLQFYGLFKQATVGDVNTGEGGLLPAWGRWQSPGSSSSEADAGATRAAAGEAVTDSRHSTTLSSCWRVVVWRAQEGEADLA